MTRSRRAPLFFPGDSAKKIAKAATLKADVVVLDLEDGVAASQKLAARATVAKALEHVDFGGSERLVRINAAGSGLAEADLEVTFEGRPDGYVLPKVESAEMVRAVSARLARLEREHGWPEGGIGLFALLETAGGILRAGEIAAADARVRALIFGAEDFAASVGATRTAPGLEVLYARSAVVVAAAAHGLDAVDTLFVDFHDDEGLRRDTAVTVQLGFTGKLAIHPRQVPIIHEVFSPSADEVAEARRLLEAFAAHEREGTGAFSLDGKMVDMPMVRSARRVLSRAGVVNDG